jgi:hypothetical protein
MNRHDRRRAKARSRGLTQSEVVREFVHNSVLLDAPDVPIVGVSPLVWGISPQDGRHWYFACASADANGCFHLDCLRIGEDDREVAEQTRAALFAELVSRRPIVIHDFDDEVRFAEFCAATWPSDRTRKILAEIKADYASRSVPAARSPTATEVSC